jgi:CDP-paratose 2-epimerase
MEGSRTLYGATKLASELLIEEYCAMYGLAAVLNRCGVVAGPWQMGRVDQGFFTLFAARHLWSDPLDYIGFGGTGKQVRDVLHVEDLYDLVALQARNLKAGTAPICGVGGGHANSVSLQELSRFCAERSGNVLEIGSSPDTHPTDVPYFVNDNTMITQETGWSPKRNLETLLDDVFHWLREREPELRHLLGTRNKEGRG